MLIKIDGHSMNFFSRVSNRLSCRFSQSAMRSALAPWGSLCLLDEEPSHGGRGMTSILQSLKTYMMARSKEGARPLDASSLDKFMAHWPKSGIPAERIALAAVCTRDSALGQRCSLNAPADFLSAAPSERAIAIVKSMGATDSKLSDQDKATDAIFWSEATLADALGRLADQLGHGAHDALDALMAAAESVSIANFSPNPHRHAKNPSVRL